MKIENNQGKIILALIAVLLLGLVVGTGLTNTPEQRQGEFNRADIMFMNMMIIHHDQAIEMAELAPNRTDNEQVLELAENISAAQRSENEKMSEWLREAGFRPPTRAHRMAGMATQQEMQMLENSTGREFDQLFAELMIEHHEGGINMARSEVQNGRSQKVIDLAQGMVDAQTREIELMEKWQQEWDK